MRVTVAHPISRFSNSATLRVRSVAFFSVPDFFIYPQSLRLILDFVYPPDKLHQWDRILPPLLMEIADFLQLYLMVSFRIPHTPTQA